MGVNNLLTRGGQADAESVANECERADTYDVKTGKFGEVVPLSGAGSPALPQ